MYIFCFCFHLFENYDNTYGVFLLMSKNTCAYVATRLLLLVRGDPQNENTIEGVEVIQLTSKRAWL